MRQQPIMDWEAIKAAVHRAGYSFAKIANDNGIHPTAVRNVKIKRHKAAEKAIAAFLGVRPQELWPERYHAKQPVLSTAYKELLSNRGDIQSENRVKAS